MKGVEGKGMEGKRRGKGVLGMRYVYVYMYVYVYTGFSVTLHVLTNRMIHKKQSQLPNGFAIRINILCLLRRDGDHSDTAAVCSVNLDAKHSIQRLLNYTSPKRH